MLPLPLPAERIGGADRFRHHPRLYIEWLIEEPSRLGPANRPDKKQTGYSSLRSSAPIRPLFSSSGLARRGHGIAPKVRALGTKVESRRGIGIASFTTRRRSEVPLPCSGGKQERFGFFIRDKQLL